MSITNLCAVATAKNGLIECLMVEHPDKPETRIPFIRAQGTLFVAAAYKSEKRLFASKPHLIFYAVKANNERKFEISWEELNASEEPGGLRLFMEILDDPNHPERRTPALNQVSLDEMKAAFQLTAMAAGLAERPHAVGFADEMRKMLPTLLQLRIKYESVDLSGLTTEENRMLLIVKSEIEDTVTRLRKIVG